MQASSNNSRGFTIVEMIVVVLVLGLLLNVVFVTLGDYYQNTSRSITQTTRESAARTVLRSIEKDIANASSFSPTYPLTGSISAPLGSHNDTTEWNYVNGWATDKVLIVTKTAVTQSATNDPSNARVPLFEKPAAGCGDLSAAPPAKNTYIYFVAADTNDSTKQNLYRRIITPDPDETCPTGTSAQAQKTSCAASTVSAYPLICARTDAVLVRDISAFDVQYYDAPNGPSYEDAYNSNKDNDERFPHITNARAIQVTVTTKPLPNQENGTTASIRISLY